MSRYLLLFSCIFTLNISIGQTVECTGNMVDKSITLLNAFCDNNRTDNPLDDHIIYTVSGSNLSGDQIVNLPLNTVVSPLEGVIVSIDNGTMVADLNADGPFTFTSPSPSCLPLNLSVVWSGTRCTDSDFLIVSRGVIPTMGQWGIIILGFMIFIIGYLEIKKGKNGPIYLRTDPSSLSI